MQGHSEKTTYTIFTVSVSLRKAHLSIKETAAIPMCLLFEGSNELHKQCNTFSLCLKKILMCIFHKYLTQLVNVYISQSLSFFMSLSQQWSYKCLLALIALYSYYKIVTPKKKDYG